MHEYELSGGTWALLILVGLSFGAPILGLIGFLIVPLVESRAWSLITVDRVQVGSAIDLIAGWTLIGILVGAGVGLWRGLFRVNRKVHAVLFGIPLLMLPFLVSSAGLNANAGYKDVWTDAWRRSDNQAPSPNVNSPAQNDASNNAYSSGYRPDQQPPARQRVGECEYDSECGEAGLCRNNKCLVDWWCMCYYERTEPYQNIVISTGCRRGADVCANLQRASEHGGKILVPEGVVRPCRPVPSVHPGDALGGRYGWTDSARPGSVQKVGSCEL